MMKLKPSSSPPDWAFPDRFPNDSSAAKVQNAPAVSGVVNVPKQTQRTRAALCRLSEVADEQLEWAWDRVIPQGSLTLITGATGVGKSRFTLGLVAAVSKGLSGSSFNVDEEPTVDGITDEPARDATMTNQSMNAEAGGEEKEPFTSGAPGRGRLTPSPEDWSEATNRYAGRATVLFAPASDLTDTIRPRLIEAGTDMSQVFVLCGVDDSVSESTTVDDRAATDEVEQGNACGPPHALPKRDTNPEDTAGVSSPSIRGQSTSMRPWSFQLNRDLPILEAELLRLQKEGIAIRMIVIDPIDGYLDSSVKRAFAEASVAKLVELAANSGAAIVAVSNVPPSERGRYVRRGETVAIAALSTMARANWMIVRDLEITNRRMMLPVKTNLNVNQAGLAYYLKDGTIEWDTEPVLLLGDDYVAEATELQRNPLAREFRFEKDRAIIWLHERLSAGRVASLVVQEDAALNEISYATLRRAFKCLGCKSNKEKGCGRSGKSYWRLPGEGFYYRANAPRLPDHVAHVAQLEHLIETHEK